MLLGPRRDKIFDYRHPVTMQLELPIELSFSELSNYKDRLYKKISYIL